MSKRDIETVCTLAAHLAQLGPSPYHYSPPYKTPGECAADAMKLQRLARNIRGKRMPIGEPGWGAYARTMKDKADAVLKPYGLQAHAFGGGVTILGLPGNTLGGDQDGFGI